MKAQLPQSPHNHGCHKEQSSCQIDQQELSRELVYFARAFMKHRDFDAAESMFRQALHHMQHSADATCPEQEMMQTMVNIGKCCQYTGRLEEALSCYRDALYCRSGRQDIHTESETVQLLIAGILYDIGLIQSRSYLSGQTKSPEKALQAFQMCLNLRASCLGENNPAVANVQHNVGVILSKEGHHDQAINYLLKSLESRRIALGDSHPEVASSLRHLAMVYNNMGGHHKEAERVLNEALSILRTISGECFLQEVLLELAHVKRVLSDRNGDSFSVALLKANLPKEDS
jgi:tetratricopeptide (TPR) repeat protein